MKRKYTKSALLLIDIQNDYFYKGKMEFKGSYEVVARAKKILDSFRKKRKTVIHIQHIAVKKNATHFISGTYGAEIYEEVTPKENETIIVKNTPNGFIDTGLFEYLKNNQIENLTIVGMLDNMSNDPTVRTAKDLGFNVQLWEDQKANLSVV
ncbi:cysteine hydrolase [Flavobacterium crocinum]|uniref:Cysteine hydrolase n=1 Tax=Flavobacterium crocinum TaxID=2183896 RepID=A0A2S1YNS3_9FLAO|nr:isochorismatase family protein [Flavobacterium crocinum]AWK05696.1 cysteine hydrolase [Flavobacterium crocinum]